MADKIRGTWHDDPAHFQRPSRRDFLHVGAVGALGLTLGDALRLEAAQKQFKSEVGPAKRVIQIFLPGGMTSQESFDPKLYAPVEYRGPFGHRKTAIGGERFGELFDHTAGIADRLCVVRSMTHNEAAHQRGQHNMLTGYRPSPALQFPSMGSVVAHEFGTRNNLPPYVAVPRVPNEYAGSGYLSSAYGAFSLGDNPSSKNFQVRDLSMPSGVDETRFNRRRSMLSAVDSHFRNLESSGNLDAMDSFYQKAYDMVSSKEAREAFALEKEPKELRKRYGMNAAGQRMLMCRRLVEAGVRYVTMSYGGWDHHNNIEQNMKRRVPALDKAFATLIKDLEERGMLDDTLVMLTTEFGRTPKINNNAGRDHYPKVFSIAMAGGGLKKGFVYGKSNSTSTAPDENPVTVPDWATTVYNQIGINAQKELMAPGDRPIEIVKGGSVVRDLIA